jgi:hypothetical protein
MTSGQDVSEYIDTLGVIKSYFFKFFEEKNEKKLKKNMSWCSDAPEDEVISLLAGLLTNPDVPLSHRWLGGEVSDVGTSSWLVTSQCLVLLVL